jgi:hypothetical protein
VLGEPRQRHGPAHLAHVRSGREDARRAHDNSVLITSLFAASESPTAVRGHHGKPRAVAIDNNRFVAAADETSVVRISRTHGGAVEEATSAHYPSPDATELVEGGLPTPVGATSGWVLSLVVALWARFGGAVASLTNDLRAPGSAGRLRTTYTWWPHP